MMESFEPIPAMYPGHRFKTESHYSWIDYQGAGDHGHDAPSGLAYRVERFLIRRIGSVVFSGEIRAYMNLGRNSSVEDLLTVTEHPGIRVAVYQLERDDAVRLGLRANGTGFVPVLKRSAGGYR